MAPKISTINGIGYKYDKQIANKIDNGKYGKNDGRLTKAEIKAYRADIKDNANPKQGDYRKIAAADRLLKMWSQDEFIESRVPPRAIGNTKPK